MKTEILSTLILSVTITSMYAFSELYSKVLGTEIFITGAVSSTILTFSSFKAVFSFPELSFADALNTTNFEVFPSKPLSSAV